MKVNRKDFMKALSSVLPMMGRGEQNTATNCFAFFKDSDGNSYIGTTNNAVAVIKPVTFDLDFECKVQGTKLFQLIKKLTKATELELTLGEDYLTIKSDLNTESCIGVIYDTKNMLDFVTNIPEEDFKQVPDNFTEALQECSLYVEEESSASILQYVYADGNKIVSANNGEIVLCKLNGTVDKMFISAKDVPPMKGYVLTEYASDDNLLYFKTKDNAYIAVQPASTKERYPVVITPSDYTEEELNGAMSPFLIKNLFNTENMRFIEFSKNVGKEVVDVLNTCSMFTDNGNTGIKCVFDKNTVTITGIDTSGKHTQVVTLDEYVSTGFSFETHPQMLIDIIERGDVMYVGRGKVIIKNDKVAHLIQIKE